MKIVLCNHAKNNYTNKYNGTNNNIVHDYNIIQVVFLYYYYGYYLSYYTNY